MLELSIHAMSGYENLVPKLCCMTTYLFLSSFLKEVNCTRKLTKTRVLEGTCLAYIGLRYSEHSLFQELIEQWRYRFGVIRCRLVGGLVHSVYSERNKLKENDHAKNTAYSEKRPTSGKCSCGDCEIVRSDDRLYSSVAP